jgi:hypothetical protein
VCALLLLYPPDGFLLALFSRISVSISLDLVGCVLLFVCSCVCGLDCFPVARLHCWPLVIFLNYLSVCLPCLLQGQQLPARSCSRVLSVGFYCFWWMIIFPLFSRSRRQSSDRKDERRREQETEWLTKRTMNTTICSR